LKNLCQTIIGRSGIGGDLLFRRAAAHPTEGGKKTDRILLAEAERLEREAAENEELIALEARRNR
jgi:hypothetical protein